MTTDNKNLADVQPGGMVRLGEPVAWMTHHDEPMLFPTAAEAASYCDDDESPIPLYRNAGDPIFDVEAMLTACVPGGDTVDPQLVADNIRHWFAAQPSPGGQDGLNYERMFVDACAALAEVSRELGCDPEHGGAEPILAAIAELQEALAARQPAGQEPVAVSITPEMRAAFRRAYREGGFWADRLDTALNAMMRVAPPEQALFAAEERAHGETIDQRDRYHEAADELASHIERITGVEIGEHSSANCPWQNAIEAAEEYTPPQAVDLGQFRDLSAAWIGTTPHPKASARGAWVACARDLLALIDSHAAGK